MAPIQKILNSFAGGEVSPDLYGRMDQERYRASARTIKNMICDPRGGVMNRPGTLYIGTVVDSTKSHRLETFQFSTSQGYALLFTDLKVYIIFNGGFVDDPASPGNPYGITTVYPHGELNEIQVDQTADVMYLAHPNYPVQKLTRLDDDDWEIVPAPFYDGPWADVPRGHDSTSVTINGRRGVLSAISSTGLFTAEMVGSYIRLGYPGYFAAADKQWGVGAITSFISATQVTVNTLPLAGVAEKPFGYCYNKNPDFAEGSTYWREDSDMQVVETGTQYEWRASTEVGATNQYYLSLNGGPTNPVVLKPPRVYYSDGIMVERDGIPLVDSYTWKWDDADSLGWDTLYVRITGSIPGTSLVTFPSGEIDFFSTAESAVISTNSDSVAVKTSIRQSFDVVPNADYMLYLTVTSVSVAAALPYLTLGTTQDGVDIQAEIQLTNARRHGIRIRTGDAQVKANIRLYVKSSASVTLTATVTEIAFMSDMQKTSLQTYDWRLSTWRGVAPGQLSSYPRSVGFFEQRLIFGGSDYNPQTVWHSKTGDFEDFGFHTPLQDDDAIQYTLATRQVNNVRWIKAVKELILGTSGAEWKASRGAQTSSMTPGSIDVKAQSYHGSAALDALGIGDDLIFLLRGSDQIRSLTYSTEAGGHTGGLLTHYANHLLKGHSIVSWAYARLPESVIWCVREDGILLGLTYQKDNDVFAWHTHEGQYLPHYSTGVSTLDSKFESVNVVSDDSVDDVYFVIRRNLSLASSIRTVEKLNYRKRAPDATANGDSDFDYFFVDSGLTYYNVTEYDTVTGLDHLDDKTVSVLADGNVYTDLVVAAGSLTLPALHNLVSIGLPITSTLETLDIEMDGNTIQGKRRSINSVVAKLKETMAFFAGPTPDRLTEAPMRNQSQEDGPVPPYTGDIQVRLPGVTQEEETGRVSIVNTKPTPITVLAVTLEVDVSEMQ